MPAGFNVGDPRLAGLRLAASTTASSSAPAGMGCKVFLTLSPPIPNWASEQPRAAPTGSGGYRNLGRSCMWKPGRAHVRAVRPRGGPALPRQGAPLLDLERAQPGALPLPAAEAHSPRNGGRCRSSATASCGGQGWKRHRRRRSAAAQAVLFGETAAISSPMDTLYAALCLDETRAPVQGPAAGAARVHPAAEAADRRHRPPPLQQGRHAGRCSRARSRSTRCRSPTSVG